jgi:two-component system LytT family response regulator
MIRAFIVDDEEHNRSVLKTLLSKFSENVNIVGEAGNADDAYLKICELKPQLVFLDVKMPHKNGFDLLKLFNEICFEVIFVTAYDEFAINAFELNAIGYILKPIDYTLLRNTVAKAELIINSNRSEKIISEFVQTLSLDNSAINKISVHHNDKVVFIDFEEILSIHSKDGYCEINTVEKAKFYSSKELKMYENVFKGFNRLLRINKSSIINLKYIKSYSKGESCFIELTDGQLLEVPRRKKAEILSVLKHI